METDVLIGRLRNPYGLSQEELRNDRHCAAEKIELLMDAYLNMREWAEKNGLDTTTSGDMV